MSLNDPHWGRGPDDGKRNDEERGDGEGRSADNRNHDERDDRPEDGRRNDDRRDRRGPEEDLDRLWGEFSDMLNGMLGGGGRGRRQQQEDPLSRLKSRDDFSREDDEEDDRPATQPQGRADDRRDDRGYRDAGRTGGDRRFEKKIVIKAGPGLFGGLFGGGGSGRSGGRSGGFGVGFIAAAVAIAWGVSGFYIVPEGQTGVVTTFGRYQKSTLPGINWHIPAPVQDVELVDVSSVRTAEIGMRGSADRLREALMLTDDENIVDVQFNVQYRIKPETGARDFLFNTRAPDMSVTQAAESAMREVVGRKTMDSVLFESKAEIAEAVRASMQAMLDRYSTGIEVMSVAIQNAQPPQQVQAAFNDAVKAGQDRERSINLGEAYMNAVIPKAQGTASRLKEEAEGYKARVIETARGDADRFSSVYAEYRKAPQVTRDRIYVDAMRDIYENVTKVYVDQKSGSSLLYLPLDKLVASTQAAARGEAETAPAAGQTPAAPARTAAPAAATPSSPTNGSGATYTTDVDPRDMIRGRVR